MVEIAVPPISQQVVHKDYLMTVLSALHNAVFKIVFLIVLVDCLTILTIL